MTTPTAPRYLPWLRIGLTTAISELAVDGLASHDSTTASVAIELTSTGDETERTDPVAGPPLRLYGPADVVGIDPAQVLRCDPEPDATDAEANYFALIELTAPDLPWRYTPAAPDANGLLQPWLALVVVEEREGVWLEDRGPALRPVLHVDSAEVELPDLDQCWAWAHVQAEHDLADGVPAALAEAPELFRSRLLCPRRLPPERAWLACLVPTFEAGRRSGLGEPGGTDLGHAWSRTSVDVNLPVYHYWRFRTGERGDFESLVRRLRPVELPATVGRRDLDIGVLVTYSGALVSPALGGERVWPEDHRTTTKNELRRRLNQSLATPPAPEPLEYDALRDDPIIGPPAYAAPQAKRRRVPREGDVPIWFEELNTEPHRRAVAGLGAEVVRRDQEAMVAAAWSYASEQADVNRFLGRARLGWELARKAQPRFASMSDVTLLQVAAPALPRLASPTGGTMLGEMASSALPEGMVSGAFRRLTRGTKALARTDAVVSAALDDAVSFSAAWTAVRAPVGADLQGQEAPTSGYIPGGPVATGPAAGGLAQGNPGGSVGGPVKGGIAQGGVAAGAAASPAGDVQSGGRVRGPLYGRVRGRAAVPGAGEGAKPREIAAVRPTVVARATVANPVGLPATGFASHVRAALDPLDTITKMVETRVIGLSSDRDHDVPDRVWVRPQFTTPMYERLRALSVEYLVPGIGAVPDNSLGLLRAKQDFVEAFLGGLNHELGRELLWREYPARLSATWCQQFFDTGPGGPADITVIGSWDPETGLGSNHPPTTAAADLVLLIKGALPRRYPDLRVYAVEAQWVDGKRREAIGGGVRLPVFSGRLQRDAYFYGFALSESEARGSTVEPNHPGWFFVLEQRPRAPRFGLDAPRERLRGKAPARWSDLSWANLVEAEMTLPSFVDARGPQWLVDAGALRGNGGPDAWGEDAAAMARITLQRPIRMLTHADSMLPPPAGLPPLGGILDGLPGPRDGEPTLVLPLGGRR